MAERPKADSAFSDGLLAGGGDRPGRDVSDDELARALAAVFQVPSESPTGDEVSAPEEAPSPVSSSEWEPMEVASPGGVDSTTVIGDDAAPPKVDEGDDGWSWWDADPDDDRARQTPSGSDGAATALQEAGFGGPLHSALGELGRIIPAPSTDTSPPEQWAQVGTAVPRVPPTDTLPRSPRWSRRWPWLSADDLRHAWLSHRHDWGPALAVAALVLVAFVVVLAAGREPPPSRVNTRSNATSVPTTAATVPTTLFEDVLPQDDPVDAEVAATEESSTAPSAGWARPRRVGAARPPTPAPPAQARPRSGGGPAPANAAPANPAPVKPPVDDPPAARPPSQTTVPSTAPVTTRPPRSDDPCAGLQEPLRSRCKQAVDRP